MANQDDPKQEGHTREWQDRARVVLDAKKDAGSEASPRQSPEQKKKSEESTEELKEADKKQKDDDETFY